MQSEPAQLTAVKIEQWKSLLIDTSKRNRLLYFKPSKRGSVQLKEPSPDILYDIVARLGNPLKFPATEQKLILHRVILTHATSFTVLNELREEFPSFRI